MRETTRLSETFSVVFYIEMELPGVAFLVETSVCLSQPALYRQPFPNYARLWLPQ